MAIRIDGNLINGRVIATARERSIMRVGCAIRLTVSVGAWARYTPIPGTGPSVPRRRTRALWSNRG